MIIQHTLHECRVNGALVIERGIAFIVRNRRCQFDDETTIRRNIVWLLRWLIAIGALIRLVGRPWSSKFGMLLLESSLKSELICSGFIC